MPVTITIPTALRQFANEHSELQVDARTVGQALAQLTSAHRELRQHLYRNGNELRNFINVYVNDEDIRHLQRLETAVKEGDVVTIVPSIAGGAVTEPRAVPTGLPAQHDEVLPSLTNDEISRYSRHLIMPEVGMDGQRRLKASSVLMIGTGGLGAPVGMYLAAAGVG